MTDDRHYLDGKPYYCALCGLGIDEFMACEEPDCALESEEKARERQLKDKARRAKLRREPEQGQW